MLPDLSIDLHAEPNDCYMTSMLGGRDEGGGGGVDRLLGSNTDLPGRGACIM